jgi:protein TonB
MEALYRGRDWVASLPSLIVVLALFLLSAQTMVPPRQERVLPPMEISLGAPPQPAPEPEPPKVVEPPKAVEPPRPQVQQARPQAIPQQAAPVPVTATPAISEPATVPAAPAAPARVAETAPAAIEAPPSAPAAPRAQNMENSFIARVRAYLESVKRYPTGREASTLRPRGKTRVWFVLTRGGEATEAGVDDSSGSILLDNAALATVRRGRFPAFPDDAWPGKASHRFTAELDFVPAE